MEYHCTHCGGVHEGLPDLASDRPDQWWLVPEAERDRRIVLTSDTCVINGEDHFIRGVLQIPIHNQPLPFGLGVWISLKRENFQTYLANFDTAKIGPFFGWLCTRIAHYRESSMLLKTRAHFQGNGKRPLIELEPTNHPLAVDQRNGLSLEKAWEYVHFYPKPQGSKGGQ